MMMSPSNPTWQDDIAALFARPYWVANPPQVAGEWLGCMQGYGIQLNQYSSVKQWAILIFQYLYCREMPLTDDLSEMWPDAALETFRSWVNQGYRQSSTDPLDPADRIPEPRPRPLPMRVRRDILTLSSAELDDYRMRFDDAFQVQDASSDASGQAFFGVHGDWCLHYQEAFLLWHRAYLIAFENRIGGPVPYWNWYAQDASIDGSPSSGIPQAFKDETYVHPQTGEVRPNPLRYAAAKGGVSKACMCGQPASDDCFWIHRDPLLYTSGDTDRQAREQKIALTLLYQQQVQRALAFKDFSHPQGVGYPWANILSFNPPPPDSEYVYRNVNFDGAYEQPHDNYHGWVGPDMADNAFTAFDPIFWSYHANIDRIFEIWLRANSNTATFTANYPIRPFVGADATQFEFADHRPYVFTTIGDLSKDSRALGYDFDTPAYPDFGTGAGHLLQMGRTTGGRSQNVTAATVPEVELLVVFDGIRCTFDSYAVDVFLDQHNPQTSDVSTANPNYVGRLTRIGMGVADDKGRCVAQGVRRVLDATAAAHRLGIDRPTLPTVSLLVTDLPSGEVTPEATHCALPGFSAVAVWSDRGVVSALPTSSSPEPCCSSTPLNV